MAIGRPGELPALKRAVIGSPLCAAITPPIPTCAMRTTTASSVRRSCRTVEGERRAARRRPPSQASATGSGPWRPPWRCGRLSWAGWRVRPRRRDRAPCAGCGLGVGRAGGSWAASSTSRRYCGTKTDATSPEGPACAKTSGSAGAVDDSGVVGSVWPCDVAQRSCAHGPVPGTGETPPAPRNTVAAACRIASAGKNPVGGPRAGR